MDHLKTSLADAYDMRIADLELLAIVTVTYNPDLDILVRQLDQMPVGPLKIIVDNASAPELCLAIRGVAAEHGVIMLHNELNRGLPAALNQGASYAERLRPSCRFLLFLDQDTEPGPAGIEQLVAAYRRIAALTQKLFCIGPRLVDVETGLDHGFHQVRGWRWSRNFPSHDSPTPIPLANLNGSGMLMPFALFNELGGLQEDLFIDHVDTEWAFRVLASGYCLYGIPSVAFSHRMGERGLRFWWFGWRVWPQRSPTRHYYLFRNSGFLMSCDYVPRVWKIWAVAKLAMTMLLHGLIDSRRVSQLRNMFRGIRDGRRMVHRKRATLSD